MSNVGEIYGHEFLDTAPNFFERERKILRRMLTSRHKTCHQEISRPSHAVTAKKCTKKCNAIAELLLWLQSLCFFDVVVAVAVALLKLVVSALATTTKTAVKTSLLK